MNGFSRSIVIALVMITALLAPASGICASGDEGPGGFVIRSFDLQGNTILSESRLTEIVQPFIGSGKTAADVEQARDALEKTYHDVGYPAVIVNIPAQTLKDGVVVLQVIESRIGRVRVTGNRYFTKEKLMQDLPSLAPGKMLYLPDVQKDIGRLNRDNDIKVDPIMSAGKEPGTIDVELKVTDALPLHGSLELNNRSSHDTTQLRLNAMLRYDNLWQKGHSLTLQYQTAPQKPSEVELAIAAYALPGIAVDDDQLALYGIWSDSSTAFGEGFQVTGKGEIFGARYVLPLLPYKLYTHNVSLGFDYKHLNQQLNVNTEEVSQTPITYMPLSVAYSASLPDARGGTTQFNAGLTMSVRGVGSDQSQYDNKRVHATGNFSYFTVGLQRTQKLPLEMGLLIKIDGQMADQPLVDSEQYVAGGMESVRGYKESEAAGDDAAHAVLELSFPNPFAKSTSMKWLQMTPYLFYDIAALNIQDPLPETPGNITLEGTGAGIRGSLGKHLEYELDWAVALRATDRVKRNDQAGYFKLKAVF